MLNRWINQLFNQLSFPWSLNRGIYRQCLVKLKRQCNDQFAYMPHYVFVVMHESRTICTSWLYRFCSHSVWPRIWQSTFAKFFFLKTNCEEHCWLLTNLPWLKQLFNQLSFPWSLNGGNNDLLMYLHANDFMIWTSLINTVKWTNLLSCRNAS